MDVKFSIGKKSNLPSSLSAGMIRLTSDTSEIYVDINAQTRLAVKDPSKAPISHATSSTTYGVSSASNYGHAKASSTTPKAAGTAALGTEVTSFARGDHVHPLQTSVSGSSGSCTGNAASATKLQNARTINGVSFDGTKNITIPVDSNTLLNMIYPVGSIYLSTSDVNPSTFIGGTWESYGQGRVLVGVDPSDDDLNQPNVEGGEKTHILTVSELPSHSHQFTGATSTSSKVELPQHTHTFSGNTSSSLGTHTHSLSTTTTSAGSHTHTISGTAASAGSHYHRYILTPSDTGSITNRWVPDSSVVNRKTQFNNGVDYMQAAGAHTHSVSGSAASSGSHTHTVTGNTAASPNLSHLHTYSGTTFRNNLDTITVSLVPKGSISNTGEAADHNNMQPYVTCYMWRRTA